ncbi:hypothetical protein AAFF_G00337540 [Aldrovandia affinis]|uniref:Uncharacterized protein n=1 Tax=Aldrovandia affinis TaxID=143900 RepID=A0AAD7WPG3_9TELE|nr:hypothetical protein AAFF_G00337540 [Aldrovandia affinis]
MKHFHRSMKVPLRASLKDDSWCNRLPWVLLGIRTATKEDLQSSSVELVYGQPLWVPGDFIPNASVPWFASLQRSTHPSRAEAFIPVLTSRHGLPQSWVPANLRMAELLSDTTHTRACCNHHMMVLSASWSRALKLLSSTSEVNRIMSLWTVSSPPTTMTWIALLGSPSPRGRAPPTAKPSTRPGFPTGGSAFLTAPAQAPRNRFESVVRSGPLASLKCRFL